MKKHLCLLLCLMLLTGCTARVTPTTVAVTLPPADPVWPAPHGTDGMAYTAVVPLYLPSADGQTLLAEYETLTLNRAEDSAEAIVRALLGYPGNDRVQALGAGTVLSLYGKAPVEVSGGVCTVDLASSALQLEHSDFYTVCLSLAATLGLREDITYVNVLVCDQPVGLDIAGYLPVGAVTTYAGEEISALWDLMKARATPLGQNAADTPLSSTATLYFPMADGSGIMPETRNLTFAGQSPVRLTQGLLSALSAGARYLNGSSVMPDLTALLVQDPVVSEQADGSRLITLHFSGNLEKRVTQMGIEPVCFMASLVCTITTYIPSVSAVCIVSGSTMMTSLSGTTLGTLTFRNGNQKRSQYIHLLREQVTVYMARDGMLAPVSRTTDAASAHAPGALLALLCEGPTAEEKEAGYQPVLPAGFGRNDVLGAAVEDETLLLNFSERFGLAVRAQTMDERLLCYSLVTTLGRASDLRRVRFWFAGDMEQSMGGSLYWGGSFLLDPSVVSGG